MKHFPVLCAAALLLTGCFGNPEQKIENALQQIQSTLPKDVGGGVSYIKAAYEKESGTIVYGYAISTLDTLLTAEQIESFRQATLASASVAADPIWRLAAKTGATFRCEFCLPDGREAGSFILQPSDYDCFSQ
jgi:hypothetical protein